MTTKNQVARAERMTPALPENPTTMQVIALAARDQQVDVTKMRELLQLKREEDAIQARLAFDRALTKTQRDIEPVLKDTKGEKANTKYASYAALSEAVKPIYIANGFNVSFDTGDTPAPDMVRVLAYVSHKNGHSRTYHIDMPADGKGPKGGDVMSRTHATGSCITYGKRYLLGMIFDIITVDRLNDDDGRAAGKVAGGKIDADQLETLMSHIAKVAIPIEKVCEKLGVERIQDCPADMFDRIMNGISAWGKARDNQKVKA